MPDSPMYVGLKMEVINESLRKKERHAEDFIQPCASTEAVGRKGIR